MQTNNSNMQTNNDNMRKNRNNHQTNKNNKQTNKNNSKQPQQTETQLKNKWMQKEIGTNEHNQQDKPDFQRIKRA